MRKKLIWVVEATQPDFCEDLEKYETEWNRFVVADGLAGLQFRPTKKSAKRLAKKMCREFGHEFGIWWKKGRKKWRNVLVCDEPPNRNCPNCPNQGWYYYNTHGGQEQCEWCWSNPESEFNQGK